MPTEAGETDAENLNWCGLIIKIKIERSIHKLSDLNVLQNCFNP